jgi:glutaredoxin
VIDVGADRAAREEMIKKSGQMAVPVIEIDGVSTVGFDEAGLKKQLGL